jgi:hypothetical protein
MSITISSLEIENVKRVKAVTITPTASGLTVIDGGTDARDIKNVLDLILAKCAENEDFETFIGRTE